MAVILIMLELNAFFFKVYALNQLLLLKKRLLFENRIEYFLIVLIGKFTAALY